MRIVLATALLILLASCGGGGNPLDNPPDVNNDGGGTAGTQLSFSYFQKCVNPIVTISADPDKNCANAGCHGPSGTGGAYRALVSATNVVLPVLAGQEDATRLTDMYKNYRSAAGQAVLTNPDLSRLLNKPLVRTTLHRGGAIFANANVTEARTIRFWIANPIPSTGNEFSTSIDHILFSNGDPVTGTCNQ